MLSFPDLSTREITYPSWLLRPFTFEKDASLNSTNLAFAKYSRTYRKWVSLVSCKEETTLENSLNSSSVVGLSPGAFSWTGAHTSGRIFTPTYWARAVLLANYFWLVGIWSSAIFSSGPRSNPKFSNWVTCTPLNITASFPNCTRGLCLKCFAASASRSRNACVPKTNESSTCKSFAPSRCCTVLIVWTVRRGLPQFSAYRVGTNGVQGMRDTNEGPTAECHKGALRLSTPLLVSS